MEFPGSFRNGVLLILTRVAWVACFAWAVYSHGKRASVGWVGSVFTGLALVVCCYHWCCNYYRPEEKCIACFLLKQNEKTFQLDSEKDLKEDPDLKSSCWFTLFWTDNANTPNMFESNETCSNVDKYASISVILWIPYLLEWAPGAHLFLSFQRVVLVHGRLIWRFI